MALQPINLFGMGLKADSAVLASESRLNCYYDSRQTDAGNTIAVRGTPGSYNIPISPDYIPNGIHVVNGVLYFTATGGLYSCDLSGAVTYLAPGNFGFPYTVFADNYVQLMLGPGPAGQYYIYTIATGVLAQIVDVNFPASVQSIDFISGRFVAVKRNTREAYCSAALDGMTWTYIGLPLFFTKEQASDALFAVSAHNGILTLFGNDNLEFWQDAGLQPVPFQYITGSAQAYGTKSLYSIAQVNDATYFLGHGNQGGYAVYSIKGYTVKKESTSDIDDILALWVKNGASFRYTHGVAFNNHGHDFYMLNDVGSGTLTLDTTTGLWSTMLTGNTSNSQVNATSVGHYATKAVLFEGVNVFMGSLFSGNTTLYAFDQEVNTDAGVSIQRQVTTKHIRNGGNEFSITELVLLMDIGEVPLTQDYHITLEVSKDGGRTFGSPRPRTLGLTGQYKDPQVKWQRLGSAKDFVLRFTMTDNVPFVIASAEIETSVN
jgi:hypothetical protein